MAKEPHHLGGSETIGATGERGRMTLFRDDRSEDLGAIALAVLVIAAVVVITVFVNPLAAPKPPAATPAPAAAPAR